MTDNVTSTTTVQASAREASDGLSGGSLLKKAREASGLHIGAMAVALKVPVKKLEALEADRFDLLPDTVFVRALASSICRNLKIDPAPILERLPHTAMPRLKTDEAGINTPFRENGDALNLSLWEQLSKPMVLAVLLVLVAILVLVFVPFKGIGHGAGNDGAVDVAAPAPPPGPLPETASSTPVDMKPAVESSPPAPGSVVESVALPTTVVPPVLVASASIPVVPAAPLVTDSNAALVMKARGASWVEVVDAKGGVQARKILNEGETIAVSGALPFSVVIGKADVMDVQVHGKPLDLVRLAKENVARFEVK